MTSTLVINNKYLQQYKNGKHRISLLVTIFSIVAFILEISSYQGIYSPGNYVLQLVSVSMLAATLILYLRDRERYYVLNYLIVSYCCIINIILSAVFFPDFFEKIQFSQTDFFSRDFVFILTLIAFVGFLAGTIHIFIQGLLALFYLFYEFVWIKDDFIIDSAPLYFLAIVGFCSVLFFLVIVLNKFIDALNKGNSEINQLHLIAHNKKTKLERYNKAIIELSKRSNFDKTDSVQNKKTFEAIIKSVSKNLNCSRVSIWLLSDDKLSMHKNILFENGEFDTNYTEIYSRDFPIYFNSILNEICISASDAYTNNYTQEFTESYLKLFNIYSMLDVPIKLNNEVMGVLCCENQKEIKVWQEEDVLFAQSISDFIAAQLKDMEIQSLMLNLNKKNKDILASINYARRLQSAILPSSKLVEQYLSNSFIYYKPKDIVAGDFYWLEIIGDDIIFALADCTGHGVPGAFISVVCHNALNNAVRNLNLLDPGLILDKTREYVIEQFNKNEENVYDGMDISLCIYNTKSKVLKWAGANSPLIHYKKDRIVKILPTKQSIGKSFSSLKYKTHIIQVDKGDALYFYSDGYIDQFGGVAQKKMKYKKLCELILSAKSLNMKEQKHFFEGAFENWKGSNEQVDDVSIIGVKF